MIITGSQAPSRWYRAQGTWKLLTAATRIASDLKPHDNNMFPSAFSLVKSAGDLVELLTAAI